MWGQIEHLDGHKVTIASSGVTVPGQVQRIPGEGMPLYEQVGHARSTRSLFLFRVVDQAQCSEVKERGAVMSKAGSLVVDRAW